MPDNTRTFNEPSSSTPNAPADALFGMFKQDQDLAQYAAKKDMDTGAALKLNKQRADDATALAGLHQKYSLAMTDHVADIARQNILAQGTAINALTSARGMGISKETGEAIPGINTAVPGTDQATSSGETGGAEPQFTPNALDPLAAKEAFKTVDEAGTKWLDSLSKKSDADLTMQKDLFKHQMGFATSGDVAGAKALQTDLEITDPGHPMIRQLQSIQEPGGRHDDWIKASTALSAHVDKAKQDMNHIKAMGEQRLAYGKTITEMKTKSAELIAQLKGTGQAAAIKGLTSLQSNIKAQLGSLHANQGATLKLMQDPEMSTAVRAQAQRDYGATQQLITEHEAELQNIGTHMLRAQSTTVPNGPDTTESAAMAQRIGAQVLQSKGIDPKKFTKDHPQYEEVNAASLKAYNEWLAKRNQPIDNTKQPK